VRLQSCLRTTFLVLCGPTSMNQRGSFSTSTYYRRKQLKPCGFNMRWQERVTSNNRSDSKEERECRGAAEHVLRESGKEATMSCTTPQDTIAAKYEAYSEPNSPSHEGAHFHFLPDRWLATMSYGRRGHSALFDPSRVNRNVGLSCAKSQKSRTQA